MPEWYESLTDEQIAWLKHNKTPNGLLTNDEWVLMSKVRVREREYFNGVAWTANADVLNDRRAALAHRLRPDWERPKPEPEWYELPVQMSSDNRAWCVTLPDGWLANLQYLRTRPDWLWTKWQFRDTDNRMLHIWYEYPGGLIHGDPPREFQWIREKCTSPAVPVTVRMRKEKHNV